MNVFDEPLPRKSKLIRVGGDSWNDDGPFYLAVVGYADGDTLILKGLDKTIKPSHWRAIMRYAWNLGYRRIRFTRRRDGVEKERTLTVRYPKGV